MSEVKEPKPGDYPHAKTLSAPMKELKADLCSKRVNYGNNPVLKWVGLICLLNDKNENIRPVKGSKHAPAHRSRGGPDYRIYSAPTKT